MIKLLEDYFLFLTRILPPEFSKNLTLKILRLVYNLNLISFFSIKKESIKTEYVVSSLSFKNRIGIAGGLDKNAEFFHIFGSLGFGFVEVGTITLEPQKGNPKPRIFRFSKDKNLVNSLGFNNVGSVKALENIKKLKPMFDGILGVSIGKSKTTKLKNAWQDYIHLMDYFYLDADYLAINISSPNTTNLRDLSSNENIEFLIQKISEKKIQLSDLYKKDTPIFIKLSPDEEELNLEKIIRFSEEYDLDGFICSNTTTDHSYQMSGGMSGSSLKQKALDLQKKVAEIKKDKSFLIASGGVMSADDVQERLLNSADLVQLYSGYIYYGNSLLRDALEISSS